MSIIARLQQWYLAECDGEWEHSYGVTIETLDNPGWFVSIDLSETYLSDVPFTPRTRGNSEEGGDWIWCKSDGVVFTASCGVQMLEEVLDIFLAWAEEQRSAPPAN